MLGTDLREEFPALAHTTYLNSATFGQLPRRGIEAMQGHWDRRDRFACADFISWFDDLDAIRDDAAKLIGAPSGDGVSFITNTATALSLFLRGIDWREGDEIVTLTNEFPNQVYYPAHMAKHGVRWIETEDVLSAVTPRTRAVVMSTVSYSTGFRAPVESIGPELRRRGILFFVDGTQSVGALRFDAAAAMPSMFAVDAYKWMLSPNGAGFFWIDPELMASLEPQVIGWRSHKTWRNPDDLHHGAPEFPDSAERYEGGMIPFGPLYAMGASIRMFLEFGTEAVERRVMQLADGVREILRRAGADVLSESQIVCARFEDRDSKAIVASLREQRVLIATRRGNLRISPHIYNNEDDLAKFEAALR